MSAELAHKPPAPVDLPLLSGKVVRTNRFSLRLDVRATVLTLILLAITLAIGTLSLTSGDFPVPVADVSVAWSDEVTPAPTSSSSPSACPGC